jgi:hypothetical protein
VPVSDPFLQGSAPQTDSVVSPVQYCQPVLAAGLDLASSPVVLLLVLSSDFFSSARVS